MYIPAVSFEGMSFIARYAPPQCLASYPGWYKDVFSVGLGMKYIPCAVHISDTCTVYVCTAWMRRPKYMYTVAHIKAAWYLSIRYITHDIHVYLGKNCAPYYWDNWRAGASQPSRTTGAIFLYIYISTGGCCTYRNVLRISKSANLCTEPRADLENLCFLSPMASPTQTRKRHRADEEEFTDMASLSPTKVAKVHRYVQALSLMKQSSAGTSKYFTCEVTDGQSHRRAVGFDSKVHQKLAGFYERKMPVAIGNCQIKLPVWKWLYVILLIYSNLPLNFLWMLTRCTRCGVTQKIETCKLCFHARVDLQSEGNLITVTAFTPILENICQTDDVTKAALLTSTPFNATINNNIVTSISH